VAKELDLGFGVSVTASPKDLLLISNCYRDWWIACEDDSNGKTALYLVKAVKNLDGSYTVG
jgi:hypothetical protein